MAQLPLYYKNSKAVGPGLTSTGKRWKENYLFLLILVAFVILLVGNLWFVPPVEEEKGYERVYNEFNPTVITNSYVMPMEPTLKPSQVLSNPRGPDDRGSEKEQRNDQARPEVSEEEEEDPERRVQELKEGNPKLGIPGEIEDNGKGGIAEENAPDLVRDPSMPKEEKGEEEVEPVESPAATAGLEAKVEAEEINEKRRKKVIEVSVDRPNTSQRF